VSFDERLPEGEVARTQLGLVRRGQQLQATVVAQSRAATNSIQLRSDITQTGQSITETLGFAVRDLDARDRATLGLDSSFPAILITDVKSGSQAERRFLHGDIKAGEARDCGAHDVGYGNHHMRH
jgi:hypothetical protein